MGLAPLQVHLDDEDKHGGHSGTAYAACSSPKGPDARNHLPIISARRAVCGAGGAANMSDFGSLSIARKVSGFP